MEIADYGQNYLVDGVKMRVFTADTPLQSVLLPGVRGGVRLADLDELFASKALVSAGRSSTRDWFDLYHLMTAGGYTMNDFAGVFRRGADLTRLNLALHRLCSVGPDKGDMGSPRWSRDAPTLDQIHGLFCGGTRPLRALSGDWMRCQIACPTGTLRSEWNWWCRLRT